MVYKKRVMDIRLLLDSVDIEYFKRVFYAGFKIDDAPRELLKITRVTLLGLQNLDKELQQQKLDFLEELSILLDKQTTLYCNEDE